MFLGDQKRAMWERDITPYNHLKSSLRRPSKGMMRCQSERGTSRTAQIETMCGLLEVDHHAAGSAVAQSQRQNLQGTLGIPYKKINIEHRLNEESINAQACISTIQVRLFLSLWSFLSQLWWRKRETEREKERKSLITKLGVNGCWREKCLIVR